MFLLSIKYLLSKKFQSLLTLMGVLFGACAFVVVSGFFDGFQGYLLDQLVNNNAHLQISSRDEQIQVDAVTDQLYEQDSLVHWLVAPSGQRSTSYIEFPKLWYERLHGHPWVEAFSPQVRLSAFVTRLEAEYPVRVTGARALPQSRLTNLSSYFIAGNLASLAPGKILVGHELAKKLGVTLLDVVHLAVPRRPLMPFKITGIFQTGVRDFDVGAVYIDLADAQNLAGLAARINSIGVRLYDFEKARSLAEHWQPLTSEQVESWDILNKNILNVFDIQNATRYMMIFVIILVASFGTFNVLNISVNQKRRDIAILRSIGFEPRDILVLFLSQGAILGIIGGAIGCGLGYVCCRLIEKIPFGDAPIGVGTGHLNLSFEPSIYILGLVISLFASIVSSIWPAQSAQKLTPIAIIRDVAE